MVAQRQSESGSQARSVLITGASSGIGRGLALSYAAPGVRLALVGRNAVRLAETAALCEARGASVVCGQIDVQDRDALEIWIRAIDDECPIDLAIASAGVPGGRSFGRVLEDPNRARAIIAINLVGTMNTLDPVAELMLMRGRGTIAVLGSFSALRGFPFCPAYGASKAAVHAYAEALRGALGGYGIKVSIIAPGFVDTPLSQGATCPKPLLMQVERAVSIIRRGLDRGAPLIVFPRVLYWGLMIGLLLLPKRLVDWAMARVDVDVAERIEPAVDPASD